MMSEILFDTNAFIDTYKGRSRVRPFLDAVADDSLIPYLSVITIGELWFGIRPGETEEHENLVSAFVVLPVNSAAAKLAGTWMKIYYNQGLRWNDALIISTASLQDLPVLTRDKRLANLMSAHIDFELYE